MVKSGGSFPKDPGLVLSTHMSVNCCPRGSDALLASMGTVHIRCTDMHASEIPIHITIDKK